MYNFYDTSVADFPRLSGETNDAPRINRAILAADGGVCFIPRGNYDIAETVVINNYTSLYMDPNTVLNAVEKMDYVVSYDCPPPPKTMDLYNNRTPADSKNICLEGGDINARGMASCLYVAGFHHITVRDITLHNGYPYGLYADKGYEMIANNLHAKVTMQGLAGNTAYYLPLGDSHFTDCIAVDYTNGFLIEGGSNRITRGHIWGCIIPHKEGTDVPEMLENSCSFHTTALEWQETLFRNCYADTGYVGWNIEHPSRIFGGAYLNAPDWHLEDIRVIKHNGAPLSVDGGFFRVCTEKGTLYRGQNNNVKWINNWIEGKEMYVPQNRG